MQLLVVAALLICFRGSIGTQDTVNTICVCTGTTSYFTLSTCNYLKSACTGFPQSLPSQQQMTIQLDGTFNDINGICGSSPTSTGPSYNISCDYKMNTALNDQINVNSSSCSYNVGQAANTQSPASCNLYCTLAYSFTPGTYGSTVNPSGISLNCECAAGYYLNSGGVCTKCPSNHYCTLYDVISCPPLFQSPAGSSSLLDCTVAGPNCFPGNATVELIDGTYKTMEEVKIGDRVRTGPSTFSDVYLFPHRVPEALSVFVKLTTSVGELLLTRTHYIYVNGKLVVAENVRVGDIVTTASGEKVSIIAVSSQIARGLHNPLTLDGDIVVNGIKASAYVSEFQPTLSHIILSPFRLLYNMGIDIVRGSFDSGAFMSAISIIFPQGSTDYEL